MLIENANEIQRIQKHTKFSDRETHTNREIVKVLILRSFGTDMLLLFRAQIVISVAKSMKILKLERCCHPIQHEWTDFIFFCYIIQAME